MTGKENGLNMGAGGELDLQRFFHMKFRRRLYASKIEAENRATL